MFIVIIIFSILLAVLSTVLLVKNFLITANTSSKASINIILVIFLIGSLFCSLGGIFGGFFIPEALSELNVEKTGITEAMRNSALITAKRYTNETVLLTVFGYIFLILSLVLISKIKKEKIEAVNKSKTWDWNKINNK